MKECYTRTDLASESLRGGESKLEGVRESEHQSGGFSVHTIRIEGEEAAARLDKPVGTYLSVNCGRVDRMDADERERLARVLSGELTGLACRLCKKPVDGEFSVLVAGLGNVSLTADAIGPLTVRRLDATAHLPACDPELYRQLECSAVSLIAPGVLGQSGMEAGTVLQAIVERIRPDVVIAIDALAARDLERLAATVQLSDVGIVPGSGIGNRRLAITRESLGVPVIAMGVPTVVGSSTLVYDALSHAGMEEISDELRKVLENGRDFFVSLKESDAVTEQVCAVFSRAISLAFLGGMEP